MTTRRPKFDRARKDELLALLRKGIRRTRACDKVGINRKTFNNHINKDPKFNKEVLDAEMDANELVESALFKAALGGNVTACQVWLYNRMPDRWKDKRNVGIKIEGKSGLEEIREDLRTQRKAKQSDEGNQ